jgi:cytochrome c-type biogenesis protein CcmH/NrfG
MSRERNSCQLRPDRYSLSAVLSWKQLLLCGLAMVVSVIPLGAQKIRYSPSFGVEGNPPVNVVHNWTFNTNPMADEEKCFPWKLAAVRSTTVSVTRLKVPSNARIEYEKACDASNRNRFEEAEQHARNAIDKFQDYSAAWVMLGMIHEEQHKAQEARDACSHAAAIDATYLPAYLCAAEVSARNREWEQVLNAADLALGLKSEGDPYAYYYRAMAYLHMNNRVEAKKSALQAVEIDVNHNEPSFYLLLAQIYEREGDSANAIAQLQQFLKHHTDRQQENAAKRFLAKLESQQSTK